MFFLLLILEYVLKIDEILEIEGQQLLEAFLENPDRYAEFLKGGFSLLVREVGPQYMLRRDGEGQWKGKYLFTVTESS